MLIYDSLRRSKIEFVPINDNSVGIYVCGMTVYDDCHVGHGRVIVAFDVIVRHLRSKGFDVSYVRNITDLDDKIFKRSLELGINFNELTFKTINSMWNDCTRLNCIPPDFEPRATEYIPKMIQMIQKLIALKAAYKGTGGDIYFRVKSFAEYGKLSGRNLNNILEGVRIDVSEDKEHPADFALWKKSKPGETSWSSPFGEGRPGWHIECSAMGMDILGKSFDIHGGGPDLKFPHHENEIAQSESITGCQFVNFWLHAGAVRIKNEKMSKSLGNYRSLKDIFVTTHPLIVRFFLLQSHYRSAISFTEESLEQAKSSYMRLLNQVKPIYKSEGYNFYNEDPINHELSVKFEKAMDDDFNTPKAISILFELSKTAVSGNINALKILFDLGNRLGLFPKNLIMFLGEIETLKNPNEVSQEIIEQKIQERDLARKDKNYDRADEIRIELDKLGIVIEDSKEGSRWHRK